MVRPKRSRLQIETPGISRMAHTPKNGSSSPVQSEPPQENTQVRVLGQFIRDLSFESPNVGRIQVQQGEQPAIRIEVNVNAQKVGANVYESLIEMKANCGVKAGVLYDLEIVYGAMLQIEGIPEQALEPFLLINSPALVFPFVRRLVADITREGGFPPLLLDPIDFGALYMQRRQQAQGAAGGSTPTGTA